MIYAAFGIGAGLLVLSGPTSPVMAICGTVVLCLALVCALETRHD